MNPDLCGGMFNYHEPEDTRTAEQIQADKDRIAINREIECLEFLLAKAKKRKEEILEKIEDLS